MVKTKKPKIKSKKRNKKKYKKMKNKTKINKIKTQNKSGIIDPPISNKISLGTLATEGSEDFHYQAYENIFTFFTKILEKNVHLKDILCFPKDKYDWLNSFLRINLDDEDIKSSILVERNVSLRNSGSNLKIVKDLVRTCESKGKRFFVMTVMLIVPGKPGSHANIIVIDLKEKSIELFEPHSKTTELSTLDSLEGAYTISNRLLRKTFSEILPKYSYIAPNDYLPRYGLQSKTDAYTGLCITWSMIYVHYRILNPEKSRKEIIKHMNKIKRRFILRYAGYVEQLIKNKI